MEEGKVVFIQPGDDQALAEMLERMAVIMAKKHSH